MPDVVAVEMVISMVILGIMALTLAWIGNIIIRMENLIKKINKSVEKLLEIERMKYK